ncbi:MAG TPA: hypothetical protein VJ276_15935 [Thermoanaerobaculia bacterium]|nr:hypothetical protein [Thermoanaerobaculia bacterium]
MNGSYRWAVVAALVLAAVVGGIAYNAGVAHGIEQSGKIVVAAPPPPGAYPYPYPYYGWHHHWGFGFFFVPFFFLVFGLIFLRGLFWRGRCGRHWHQRMHEEQSQP